MKVLVYVHRTEMGGSQLNAIELAARTAALGHDVTLFGPDGVLVPLARGLGLEYLVAPTAERWPSPRNVVALRRLARQRRFDVVHGYEWGPPLDLLWAMGLPSRTPAVTTVMSMSVPTVVPRHAPLVVGTADLVRASANGVAGTHLMEPPIDLAVNAPGDRSAARRRWGLADDEVLVAVVCRLTDDLDKLAGVRDAVSAVHELAATLPVRLLVVGDGPGLEEVVGVAAGVNRAHGREVVTVTGRLLDPRQAYDAADVVIGMGSSAMKGMAFGRPLVVQGEQGFCRLLDDTSLPDFLETGWFGNGGDGGDALSSVLRGLATDPDERQRLGALSQRVAQDRFGLDGATDRLVALYADVVASPPSRALLVREAWRTTRELAKFTVVQAVRRVAPDFRRRDPQAPPAKASHREGVAA